MKRVGILLYQNLRYAPFLHTYESIIKQIENVEYDVVYLNRCPKLNEAIDKNHIPIEWRQFHGKRQSKLAKIYNSICYPFLAQRVIERERYDYLIVLTTMPAVLLCWFLCRHYCGRYLVDIRDYTQEKNKAFFYFEKKVLDKADMRIISSPGFKSFLPENVYYICHNLNEADAQGVRTQTKKKSVEEQIRISYIGSIQYTSQCKRMIDLVAIDQRFQFYFYGNEPAGHEVIDYIENKACDRIKYTGGFLPKEKERIYQETDLVFNCYGNNTPLVREAISNKYYDGAMYRKPIIVSPNTIMASLSSKYAFALDLDRAQNLDDLWQWYQCLNMTEYEAFADGVLQSARNENSKTFQLIADRLSKL